MIKQVFLLSKRSACVAVTLALLHSTPVLAADDSSASAVASPQGARSGIFKKVQGDVNIRATDGKTLRPATSGAVLAEGEKVETGKKSGAAITLRDGTELMVSSTSALALERFNYNSTTQEGNVLVNLIGGQMRMVSGLVAKTKPENVKVKTSVAIIGVRGTDFIVEAPYAQAQ